MTKLYGVSSFLYGLENEIGLSLQTTRRDNVTHACNASTYGRSKLRSHFSPFVANLSEICPKFDVLDCQIFGEGPQISDPIL